MRGSDEAPLTAFEGFALLARELNRLAAAIMSTPAARIALGKDGARYLAARLDDRADKADRHRLELRAAATPPEDR